MLYQFKIRTIIRLGLSLCLMIAIAITVVNDQWPVAILLLLPLTGVVWSLFYYTDQTNRDLAAFFNSIQYNDFTASTSGGHKGQSFQELHGRFNMINQKFQDIRAEKEANHQFLQAIVEHIDIGLLGYQADGEVMLMNKALKGMLHKSYLANVDMLETLNRPLWEMITKLEAGRRELLKLKIENKLQQIAIQATVIKLQGETFRLLSFQNIQSELEEQELVAWKKLIRILTHEIMNSVAPISSLSATISEMLEREQEVDTTLIKRSLRVIEKRSQGLLGFTETYRTLTRVPPPQFQLVDGKIIIEGIATLFQAELATKGISLDVKLPSKEVAFQADPTLLEQVIINLIRNATDAVELQQTPKIRLALSQSGQKVIITVTDNGMGMSEEVMEQIFIPFYTTKEEGSGIGLSLSRQIIGLHKGSLELQSVEGEGTVAEIVI